MGADQQRPDASAVHHQRPVQPNATAADANEHEQQRPPDPGNHPTVLFHSTRFPAVSVSNKCWMRAPIDRSLVAFFKPRLSLNKVVEEEEEKKDRKGRQRQTEKERKRKKEKES